MLFTRPVVTTTPHTSFTGVPIVWTQVVPIQTLYQECPDNPPTDTGDDTTTTRPTSAPPTVITYTTQYNSTITSTSTSTGGVLSPGPTQKGNSNLPAIIGGTVGGILAVLAIAGLVWYIVWRRKQNEFLFEDEEDDTDAHPGAAMLNDARKRRRSVNMEQEIKESRPYQYGVVGGSPSPSASPLPHSQYSSMGGYSHRRDTSRDRLMSSPPVSPNRLDIPLPGGQRRASHYSSGMPESIMMTTHTGSTNTRTSDDGRGHERVASGSLMDSTNMYPPGHAGFYQQYGPMEPARSPVGVSASPSSPPPSNVMHKPPLEPQLNPATRPVPAHQALVAAAGLLGPLPPTPTMTSGRTPVMASPPPGAAGARPYPEWREQGDMLSAVMSSGDQVAASATATQNTTDVGFGRQMRPEKSPRTETVRSPVIQHQDGGRVLDNAPTVAPATEAPPAYSQS